MQKGFDVIYQGKLKYKNCSGDADFIYKVDQKSKLGDFSYKAIDTKLSKNPKITHVMQIMIYSLMISEITGNLPNEANIVSPNITSGSGFEIFNFNTTEFINYVEKRMISLENFINKNTQPKPEPCSFCDYCCYRSHCKKIWKTEKSIFEISGVTRNQVLKLSNAGINNLEELINAKEVVSNFHNTIFEKLKLKARLRFKRLNGGEPEYKIIRGDRSGLIVFLPKENSNDLYFDIEGDPLFDEGLEYLFGFVVGNQKSSSFKSIWAHNKYEEKKAAKEVITFLYNHCEQNPNAHIYHYNS